MTAKADRSASSREELYRELPSVNELLLTETAQLLLSAHPRSAVLRACRSALEETRKEIASGTAPRDALFDRIRELPQIIARELNQCPRYSLRPVINATGVLLHTNLGRAPLSRQALDHVTEVAGGYSNLEFDLERGDRGKRDVHVEALLLRLLEGEADREIAGEAHRAVVVNNCAAATFLALHALAKGREVIVSRGELVEIGGGFRIPEILQESGALLKEVGTTNRTRIADYEQAISPNTGLILRVHQSNFSMEGFVERPTLQELVALGGRKNLPVFEDQGTGLVQSLESYGICGEPTLAKSIAAGCDLVAASGDKLLGGPQCGILFGKKPLVEAIRKDPLFRTYRADKLNCAALEATLKQYLAGASEEIPVLRMLAIREQDLAKRCVHLASAIQNEQLTVEVVPVESVVGGGTTPKARLKSFAVSLKHAALRSEALSRTLRLLDRAVIGRIEEDRVLLDLRTVEPDHDAYLIEALSTLTVPEEPGLRGQS